MKRALAVFTSRSAKWRLVTFIVALACVRPSLAAARSPEQPVPRTVRGAFGPFRIGPALGVGAPEGFAGAILLRSTHFGVGARATYLPAVTLPGFGLEVARFSAAGDLRWYPFGGAFFVGGTVGYGRTLASASKSVNVADTPTRARGNVLMTNVFAGPQVGLQFRIRLGSSERSAEITLGTDIGLAIPLWTTEPLATVTARGLTVPAPPDAATADVLKGISKIPVPWLGLLNVGLLL